MSAEKASKSWENDLCVTVENKKALGRAHSNPVMLLFPGRQEETGHIVKIASSTSKSTNGRC